MRQSPRNSKKQDPIPNWLLNTGLSLFRTLGGIFGLFIVAIPIQIALQIHSQKASSGMYVIAGLGAISVLLISWAEGRCSAAKQKQDKETERKAALADAKALEEWKRKRFKD